MSCEVCDWIDTDKNVVYQDQDVVVMMHPEPTVEGHVIVVPRQHYTIIEQVPNEVVEKLFIISNLISSAVFEMLGAQGTNLLVNNGVSAGQRMPHFLINVIPRKQDDNLNYRWVPKKLGQQEFQDCFVKIKDKCDYIGHEPVKKEPVSLNQEKKIDVVEKDYRFKQLERTP